MGILLLVCIVLGFIHLTNWLITKGIIFAAYNLFNVNWYNKFWAVYLLLILIGIIFRGLVTVNKKEK